MRSIIIPNKEMVEQALKELEEEDVRLISLELHNKLYLLNNITKEHKGEK